MMIQVDSTKYKDFKTFTSREKKLEHIYCTFEVDCSLKRLGKTGGCKNYTLELAVRNLEVLF